MKCVVMTFWQYVLNGLKDFFSSPKPTENKSWTTNVFSMLCGALVGLLIVCLFRLLGVFEQAAWTAFWFLVFALVIEIIALVVFLVISWRKAMRDCWDKF